MNFSSLFSKKDVIQVDTNEQSQFKSKVILELLIRKTELEKIILADVMKDISPIILMAPTTSKLIDLVIKLDIKKRLDMEESVERMSGTTLKGS